MRQTNASDQQLFIIDKLPTMQCSYLLSFILIEGGGSPDPKLNKRLADAVELAKSNQVPVENIQRALTAAKVRTDAVLA